MVRKGKQKEKMACKTNKKPNSNKKCLKGHYQSLADFASDSIKFDVTFRKLNLASVLLCLILFCYIPPGISKTSAISGYLTQV